MKRLLALLMVLVLLSGASLGFAEDTNADWKERLSTAVDDLRKDVQEAGTKAAEAITEAAGQLSETVGSALSSAAEEVETYSEQAVTALRTAQAVAPVAVEMGRAAAVGKIEEVSKQISDALESAKTNLPQYLEQAKNTVSERLKELSDQVSGIRAIVEKTAGQLQSVAAQKADELTQMAREKLLNALSNAWKSAVDQLKALVDWLKGGDQPAAPVINPPNGTVDLETAAQQVFYPLSDYGFYFGMPWKEAKALNANWLNDARANAYARARALVTLNQEGTSLYFLWFAGETEDAPLFEVDEFAFTAQDTLVPPQDINGQYSFMTTDATVKQVYAEKERSCGQRFGSPSSLENGLLVSSLMFHENDMNISQAQVYFLQNQESVLVATHFVYTTDCGVNVIVYQYT